MNNNKRKRILCCDLLIPIIVLIILLAVNTWFLIARGNAYIDSDMASNFLMAVNANEMHALLADNWYYSTGVSIFSDANIFQLVLLFINDNIKLNSYITWESRGILSSMN